VFPESDTSWVFEKYNLYGPIINAVRYKDEMGTLANGNAIFYNHEGRIDSMGAYSNGHQDGKWIIEDTKGRYAFEKAYENGTLISTKDLLKAPKEEKKISTGSDPGKKVKEFESSFPTGLEGWVDYLNNNKEYPERAKGVGKNGQVIVDFIVDTAGYVLNPHLVQSIEYSLDREALRLIRESPQWIPGSQDGKKVKTYKRQPITFTAE